MSNPWQGADRPATDADLTAYVQVVLVGMARAVDELHQALAGVTRIVAVRRSQPTGPSGAPAPGQIRIDAWCYQPPRPNHPSSTGKAVEER